MSKYILSLFITLSLNGIAQKSFDWCFVENKGQFNPEVNFRHQLKNGALFLTKTGLKYHLQKKTGHSHDSDSPKIKQHHAFSVDFLNANTNGTLESEAPTNHYFNFLQGSDRSQWQSKVRGYEQVKYNNIYDNIDFVMYDRNAVLKYDFIVKKGGDPQIIQLKYNNLQNLFIDAEGKLHLENAVSEIVEDAPLVYQMIKGKKVIVEAKYELNNNTISYLFPNGYDSNYDLVIDPTLIMSTYSGATDVYSTNCSTYDTDGNLYVAGGSLFASFPVTAGAYQTVYQGFGAENVAIQKFDQAGNLLFATYYGGEDSYPLDMVITNNQRLAILVSTTGGMPTVANSAQPALAGGKDYGIGTLSLDGAFAFNATYLGGTGDEALGAAASDNAAGLFVDAGNNILVCGGTESADFPVSAGAYQTALNGVADGIITSFNALLTATNWSTYLGGSDSEVSNSLAVGPNGNVYVVGITLSNDFPTTAGSLNPGSVGGGTLDGYVTELSANGGALVASTYLGTFGNDRAKFVIINDANEVIVGGSTTGNYPVSAGAYSSQSANNLFVHKLDATLSTTIFSTGVGCSATQQPEIFMTAMGLDYCEKIYFTGASTGNDFPTTPNAYTTAEKGLYMCVLEPDAAGLHYGTYFGGNVNGQHFHPGSKSKYNNEGILFHTECTQSVDYPILGGINTQNVFGGSFDGASFIFDFEFDQPIFQTNIPDPSGCTFPVTLDASHPDNENVSYLWSTGETSEAINVNANGIYSVEIFNFCDTIRDTVDVTLSGVNVDFTINKSIDCEGRPFAFTDLSVDVPTNATYLWDFGDGGTSSLVNPTHSYAQEGLYTVELKISAGGCSSFEIKTDTIAINPNPTASFSFTPEQIDIENPTAQFINESSADALDLIWYFGFVEDVRILPDPFYTFPDETSGTYPVSLVAENNFGCTDSSTLFVTVDDVITLYVPNSFTPEESGTNNIFQPIITSGVDPYNYRLLVFNRGGEIIFESRDYDRGWNGKFDNEIVQQGAYIWQIDFKETDGSREFNYQGHVTVLR